MLLSSTLLSAALLTLASGTSLSGEATFYGGNVAGGHCSYTTYTIPSGIFGTALANWDDSSNCGACVSVTGPSGNAITAMIVDECPNCGTNHLDLFPDAFAALADPSKGIIDVTWSYVDCPITSPLELHNKDGVSAYWFSMQVVNANKAVKSLEVSTDGGSTWQSTTRQTYNFFENPSGFGSTVDVKVTSVDGDVVVVKNVGVSSGASVTASSNFGSSGSTAAQSPAQSPAQSQPSSTLPPPVVAETPAAVPDTASTAPESPAAPVSPVAPVYPAAPVASTYPGANFAETTANPTTLATVVAPPTSSTTSTKQKKPCTGKHSSSVPAKLVSAESTPTPSTSAISSAVATPTISNYPTSIPSVYTTPSGIKTSAASGNTTSTSTTAPVAPTTSLIPFSGAPQLTAGFGSLIAVCIAALVAF